MRQEQPQHALGVLAGLGAVPAAATHRPAAYCTPDLCTSTYRSDGVRKFPAATREDVPRIEQLLLALDQRDSVTVPPLRQARIACRRATGRSVSIISAVLTLS